MAKSDAWEGKWRRNWQMEWVASTLHTPSERGVSSITTAGAHTSAASSRLNWRPRRFKWIRPFRRKMKSGLCVCAITFQIQSTNVGAVAMPTCASMVTKDIGVTWLLWLGTRSAVSPNCTTWSRRKNLRLFKIPVHRPAVFTDKFRAFCQQGKQTRAHYRQLDHGRFLPHSLPFIFH